jgi:hypothetical protein
MATPAATTSKKPAKPPVPAFKRISETLKREAVRGKLTKDELGKLSELATALVAFAN